MTESSTKLGRPFRHLCSEADARDAMSDGEFWEHVFHQDAEGYEEEPPEVTTEPYQTEPCPECGGYGACAWDAEGRPLIHAVVDHDAGGHQPTGGER